jgi:hypothetical protein
LRVHISGLRTWPGCASGSDFATALDFRQRYRAARALPRYCPVCEPHAARMATPVSDAVSKYINNLSNYECAQATLLAAVSVAGDLTFVGAGIKAAGFSLKGISFLNQAIRASGKAPGELVVASLKRFEAARFIGE